jgi:predicted NUDIX family NTP pyrophosphohydrolase
VKDALAEVDAALADTREDAGDEVAELVAEQDLYQAELEVALDDLSSQAGEFRAQGPEVQEAFGVQSSLNQSSQNSSRAVTAWSGKSENTPSMPSS